MGEISSHCGYLVGGFCGYIVESGGFDSFQIFSSSYLSIYFLYAMMIMITSMHKTGSPGRGRDVGRRV